MKKPIIEICELGNGPQAIIHRDGEPIPELIFVTDLVEELNEQLRKHSIVRPAGDFNRALELLRDLADIQNGPPLVTYEKEWNEIMNNVYSFLKEHESAQEGEPLPAEGVAQGGSVECPHTEALYHRGYICRECKVAL